jgi:hypothetical protein
MCEECEETEPLYVAYFGKAGGSLWRPPQAAASEPGCDTNATTQMQTRFACDDASQGRERELI